MTLPVFWDKGGIDVTDVIVWSGRYYQILRGPIVAGSNGNNEIVAALAGHKTILLAYNLMADGAANAKWRSANTDITGRKFFVEAGRGIVVPYNPKGWCITAAGEALNLNLSAGSVNVEGEGAWVQVPA